MTKGPFGGPRPLAEREKAPLGVSNDEGEQIIQSYVDWLSDKYNVDPPEVKVRRDKVWIQIVIDPETVLANYNRRLEMINLNDADIKYEYVIHEFAHHLVAKKEHLEIDPDDIPPDEPKLYELINEMEAEDTARNIAGLKDVRNNWNELVAKGAGLNEVDVAVR